MKDKNVVIGMIITFLVILLFGGFGMMSWSGYGMMGMMYGYDSGMWIFNWIYMILVAVALVLLIIWLIKQINK